MPFLYVTLLQATDLPKGDYGLLGGSSDPYVKFQVNKEIQQSSTKTNTLNPIWQPAEQFEFEIHDIENSILKIEVWDYDAVKTGDLLGTLDLPILKFAPKDDANPDEAQETSVVETYLLNVPSEYEHEKKNSSIQLDIAFKIEPKNECVLQLWENEHWTSSEGWVPANTKDQKQWSTYGNEISSMDFEDVAPQVPEGFESGGWGFLVQRGDANGWIYGPSWHGPWSEKTTLSFMRRRRWYNTCKKVE